MEHIYQDNFLETQANLTINVLKHILTSENAVAFSPYSLTLSMAMIYIGARGETETELKNLLSPHTVKEEYFRMLKDSIGNIFSKSSKSRSTFIGNRIFVQNDYVVEEKFKNDIENYLAVTFENINFSDPIKSAEIINDFISNTTHHKIKDVTTSYYISKDAQATILNILYFRSKWEVMFYNYRTIGDVFYTINNERKIIKMMRARRLFAYGGDYDFHTIKIPYEHDDSNFVLILPKEKNKLDSLFKKMDGKSLLKLISSAYSYKEVNLTMPKFKFESSYSIKEALTKMGLLTPFSEKANFTGITSNVGFWFEDVFQKVSIDVNEKGTKAEPEIPSIGLNREEEITIKADHPFLYIVLDNEKILFSGIYQ